MKFYYYALMLGASFGLFQSCKDAEANAEKPKADILRADLDTTVNPGQDFFTYANGTWLKQNPIPETESRWGIGNKVNDEIYAQLRKLNEDAMKEKAAPGSSTQRIGDFYASAMDSEAIDKMGLHPMQNEIEQINAIKDMSSLVKALEMLHTYRVTACFNIYVSQDEKNSDVMALHLWQGGLGLPNRDYYFNADSRTKNIREEYVKYLTKAIGSSGDNPETAAMKAKDVMKLETELAKSSRKLEDLRDPYSNYHKMGLKELSKLTSSINWEEFFSAIGAPKPDSVIIGQPEFFTALDKALKTYPLETWKTYLRWQLIESYADFLGGNFEKDHFYFYRTVLTGSKKQKPRWKRVIDFENQAIGEILGQLFVKEYFPAESKQRYEKLTDAILDVYRERIKKLDWMSEATKAKALNKLNHITKKVGYPDKWKDFSGMEISRQPYARNAVNINKWWFAYNIHKLGKPVDRQEWDMNPQEYNAYYNPSNNEIVLPAAIFAVPGYKDKDLDDAVIYGYAGASTIGHELTHGFDDEGRQYNEKGNLQNWWTKADEERFKEKATRYITQFNNYIVLDSLHVNGKASLGENIADLGGVVLGLEAFKKTDEYKSGKKIAGLTPLQRYFLGYALGWLTQQRPEKLANQILTDVHAPANLRVNGPFSNIPEFYQAFNVKPGQPMWRPDTARVVIW